MREEELGTYQMLWDCPTCGTEKLLGLDHRHCPNCGAAQDPSRRYFPSDQEKIAVKDHPFTGADVVCPACASPCARVAHNCPNCGSPLDEGKEVARRQDQVAGAGDTFAADSAKAAKAEHDERRRAERAARDRAAQGLPPESADAPKKGGLGKKILVAALLVIVALVVVFTWKKPVEVEAVGHSWSRRIGIEEYRRVTDSAWRDQVPFGAYSVMCHREQRSSRQVQDGETCDNVRRDQGNGTFKVVRECRPRYRSEPVYDDRCTYLVDRWVEAREAKVEGASLGDPPRWPETRIRNTGTCLGCEREGARSERYEVRFRLLPSGKEDTCTFDQAKWQTFEPGKRWPAKSRVIGGGLDCGSIGAR